MLAQESSATQSSLSEVKQQINSIKMDPAYFKAEANDSVSERALQSASNELLFQVRERYEGQGIEALSAKMLQPALKSLIYSRGSVKRVFVFLEISLIDSVAQSLGGVPPSSAPIVSSSAATAPELSENTLSDPPSQEPVVVASVPVAEKEVSDHTSIQELILLLCNVEMADEAARLLQLYKREGKIAEIGQLKQGTEVPSDAILIVYDRQKQLQALLSQDEGIVRNIKRDNPDQLSNYHDCGVLWFR